MKPWTETAAAVAAVKGAAASVAAPIGSEDNFASKHQTLKANSRALNSE
jgi:hypothetical protein